MPLPIPMLISMKRSMKINHEINMRLSTGEGVQYCPGPGIARGFHMMKFGQNNFRNVQLKRRNVIQRDLLEKKILMGRYQVKFINREPPAHSFIDSVPYDAHKKRLSRRHAEKFNNLDLMFHGTLLSLLCSETWQATNTRGGEDVSPVLFSKLM